MDRIFIFDTTLRDGEQSPGIALNAKEKLEIAEQLARLQVDVIEAGFPITSDGDFEAVKLIAENVKGPQIAALARTVDIDIDRAWEAIHDARDPRIHVFLSTSDIHRKYMLQASEEQIVAQAVEGVRRAKRYTPNVEFSPQDATRTDADFLCEVVQATIEAGATTINIPDTVGYTLPHEFEELIGYLYERVPALTEVVLSVHCHNDLGLAVANSLAAVRAGARQIEVAVNGIGERAGNCSLEEVVMAIRTRRELMWVDVEVNTREIARTSRMVSLLTGYPIQPNKAIVGANAFAHESGIHQHGVLQDRMTYEIMDAAEIGLEGGRIVLGKHSGRHAFTAQLEAMGYQLAPEELKRAFERFKELADRKIQITDTDIEAIVADEMRTADDHWEFDSLEVVGGSQISAKATVTLRSADGQTVSETAAGDGMIDAACGAVRRATGAEARLVSFNVGAVTAGTDALGDVSVQVEVEGDRWTGRGVSTDVVEASARAFLDAINRAIRVGPRERAADAPGP
ncbi:MAG TPA: 2-isopropylmalate synthase [Actinomycetota bacterium]|nr:2-isopropylmalate synthase [Actinomycetota bacterium]